jgi:hypothetical protein
MIQRSPSEWTARQERKSSSTTGVAYRSDGSWMRVHMTNLSYDGCRLLTEDPLDIGETLELVFPRTQHLNVHVRWVKDNEAGVRFLKNATAAEQRRARLGF